MVRIPFSRHQYSKQKIQYSEKVYFLLYLCFEVNYSYLSPVVVEELRKHQTM